MSPLVVGQLSESIRLSRWTSCLAQLAAPYFCQAASFAAWPRRCWRPAGASGAVFFRLMARNSPLDVDSQQLRRDPLMFPPPTKSRFLWPVASFKPTPKRLPSTKTRDPSHLRRPKLCPLPARCDSDVEPWPAARQPCLSDLHPTPLLRHLAAKGGGTLPTSMAPDRGSLEEHDLFQVPPHYVSGRKGKLSVAQSRHCTIKFLARGSGTCTCDVVRVWIPQMRLRRPARFFGSGNDINQGMI